MGNFSNSSEDSLDERLSGNLKTLVDTSLTVLAVVLAIIGTLGNLLTAYTILSVKKLRTTSNFLLASMALSDTVNVVNILTIHFRYLFSSFFRQHPDICHIAAYMIILFLMVSVQHLQVIAINRYVIVTRPRFVYRKYWGKSGTSIIISAIWLFSATLTLLPLFGIVPDINNCDYDRETESEDRAGQVWWYKTVLQLVILESCGIVTPLFFLLTFSKIRSLKNRVQTTMSSELAATATSVRFRGFTREEMAVTKMVALSFVCFLICYSPSIILHIVTIGREAHPAAITLCLIFSYSSCVMNPFIYAGMNKNFRVALVKLVKFR